MNLIGLSASYNAEGLSIYYNTTEKNTKTLNNEKQKGETLPSKKNVIVHATVSLDGSLSFGKVSSGNKLNFWPQVTQFYEDKIYFLGSEDSWMKKMTIGKAFYFIVLFFAIESVSVSLVRFALRPAR